MNYLKTNISARVLPELKEQLEMEAAESDMTLSYFLEQTLENRHELADDLDAANETVAKLKEQMASLESERGRWEETANSTDLKLATFGCFGRDLVDPGTTGELEGYFEQLENIYPGVERLDLLIASLAAALKNEKSVFFTHLISSHLNRKP